MRKQIRIVLLIMACLWCWVGALAVPANPNPHVVTQPDGTTIRVRLCGDEYYHYYTTEDGTPVTLCDDGFYRYTTIDAQNNLVASADVVGKVNTPVLPDKKSVLKRHSELYKVNKAKKVVDLPRKQAPMRSAVRNAGSKGGVVKGIIVLAEFQDQKFTFSQKAINDKMNKVGYTDEYGSIGSARDYFIAQSYGKFQPEFDVVGPVTLSQNMAYYGANYQGANDIRPHEMVAEACQLASQQGLADMSDYDHDGDGWVDLVYVIYAGYPESSGAPGETIWPHAWYVYSGGGLLVTLDGVSLNAYACSAELNGNSGLNLDGIGTFCHEYSHTLGLPDFYDIDYSGAMGMSWWSIMAHGNYGVNGYVPIGYNAYEREFCGWLEFNELTDNSSIRMPELTTDNTAAYKITSTNANQYVTIETRCRKGWDVSLPSEGMMVIAVDYNKEAWDRNGPNDDPNRQRFKLIPADDDWNESNLFGDLYPYGGNTTLSSSSSPKLRVHNTTINGKSITGIAYNNGVTTFDFKKDDVPGDEPGGDLSYLEGTYSAFAKSAFKDYPDEEWQVNITIDKTDKGKVWIQPVCMFGGLDADDISPIYATYNAADNTLVMPSGQVVYEDSDNQMVIAKTRTGSDINLTDNFVMQIEKNDYGVDISFANDCYLGVGDILNDNWWSQALYYVSYSKISSGGDEEGDEVPAELEGVYNAFANSAFKDYPDEAWQVNITIDEIKKGKVWIQPVCMFGGLDAVDISPIYATYNAADKTLNMPLGQVVFENSQYKMVIAQTTGGSDKNLTGNIVMQIENNANGVEITFAEDYIIGVGDILNDDWWYQALQNVSYSKTTAGDEPDEVPAELEGVYNAFANSAFKDYPDEEWQVNITIDNTEKGKVWIQPVCMFGGLDAVDISPIYATYNAADNTLNMPLGQVVFENSQYKMVIAQTTGGSDKNLTGNIVMQINNNANGVDISFANDCYLGVGDILNDDWWYQALQNVSYSKTTIVDEPDEVPAELEGVYNAFANSALKDRPDEEWQVNITIDETEKGKVWIQPVCMFGGLDAEYISPIYATYNAADNTLNMPLGQVVFENSQYKMVIAQTTDGSEKNLTGNIVMQIDNNANGVEITFAEDYIIGVGDILNDKWWYQALQNVSYSKTTIVDEADEVPAELEGVYNAFANSGYQGEPDEEWQVNITIDETERGKVWIQPVCMFGGLDAEYISPIYATYNAADNTLNMPLGQVVYEDSEHKLVIAQTVDGSDKNLTGNIVMQIDNNANGVEITFAEDYLLGVGDILNDNWWYQALYNISYSKTTIVDEADEVPAELEGVYNAFANSGFQDEPDERWKVNITIDNTEKGKVWIQPVCMFGGLDAEYISPIYATYNAADNTLNMPLGQVVYEDSEHKLVIAQTVDGSDKNLTDNIVMQIDNNANGVEITFAEDYIIGVGDILNDKWWYQALYNVSYSKTTAGEELATSISLDKTEVSLEVAETTMLTATVLPETATNKSVAWTSSNEAVATVDANGVVTAIALGEAVIAATTTDDSNLSASCQVTVIPTLAVSIEVTPNSVEAEENSEVQLSVNILPENATYKSVEWSSSNDAIASVNANGLVKIYKEGNVVITATTTDGTNLSATCSINVYSGIDGVNGNDVIVATIGDNIVVKNAKLGSNVRVYAADGSIITSEIATDSDVVVEAPAKGIYVVAIDGKSFKVMVK